MAQGGLKRGQMATAAALAGLLGLLAFMGLRGGSSVLLPAMDTKSSPLVDRLLTSATAEAQSQAAAPAVSAVAPAVQAPPRLPAPAAAPKPAPPPLPRHEVLAQRSTGIGLGRYRGAEALSRARAELADSDIDEGTRREVMVHLMAAESLMKDASGLTADAAVRH